MIKSCELCDRYPQQGGSDRPHLCVRCAVEARPPAKSQDDATGDLFDGWKHVNEKGSAQ